MVHFSPLPESFLLYGTILEIVFFVVTLIVALLARRIYKITKEERVGRIFYAFCLFSVAYLFEVVINLLDMASIHPVESMVIMRIPFMLFYMLGLLGLSYAILGSKDRIVFYLLGSVILVTLFETGNVIKLFYMLTSLILLFLAYYVAWKYLKGGNSKSLIFFAFIIMLLLGNVPFIIIGNLSICSVINHIVLLIAHLILFIVLFLVIKHGVKKGKTRGN